MIALLFLAAALTSTPHDDALALYQKHAYREAAAAFQKVLATETSGTPAYEESLLLLGQSLYLSNHAAEAVPYLEKAPRSNEVLYMLGTAYLSMHAFDKSEAAFAQMYGVDPASAAGHLIAAHMMIRQNFEAAAETELKRALELDPKLPQVRYLLGEISIFQGAPEQAITYLKQEAVLNPDSAMVYYKLGDAYTRTSDWNAAVIALQKSIWLNPDFSGPYILLGKSYLRINHLPDAESSLRHAIALDPRNYSAHYLLGQTLVQAGKGEEGRQMLEESQKLKRE